MQSFSSISKENGYYFDNNIYPLVLCRRLPLFMDIWISLSLLHGIQMVTSLQLGTRTRLVEYGMLVTSQSQLRYSKEISVQFVLYVSHLMASLWRWLNQQTLFMCMMWKMVLRKSKRLTFSVRYLESLSALILIPCSLGCGIELMVVSFSTTDAETIRISTLWYEYSVPLVS